MAALTIGALAALGLPFASNATEGAPVITKPAAGALVGAVPPATVSIQGSAAPGSTVEVLHAVDGSLGTATANDSGAWSMNAPLPDGSHTITATASDEAGTTPPSTPVTFEVDAVRPTVEISSPEDGHAFGAGEPLVIQGSASDERIIHAIRLEFWRLNSLVKAILADCDGCGTASTSGWTSNPTLEPGYYHLKAIAFDSAGNRSATATTNFLVSGLEGTPPFETPNLLPGDLPEIPELFSPEEGDLVPGSEEPTEFSGSAEPGSTVEIYEELVGLGVIGAVVSDDTGTWNVGVHLPTGTYGVRLRATDDEGNISPISELIIFEVDAEIPSLSDVTDEAIFVPFQNVVLSGTVLDDRATFAVVLEYWRGEERVRHEIADCTGCGERQATWEHRPEGLEPGYYHVKVRAIDEAGQRSKVSVVTFTKLGI